MGGSCSKKEMEQLFKIIDLNKNDQLDRLEITKYLKQNYFTCLINIGCMFRKCYIVCSFNISTAREKR
ncbi:EF-hand_domain pair [Hexamita inflata]|uniref:EF-hand_domain pair n=1 Tax=Hexamita inflata TaxID=28002 RepID=A0ABP1H638_9EUKA